jgi:hypothetical protein
MVKTVVRTLFLCFLFIAFKGATAQTVNVQINDPLVNQLRSTSLYVSVTVNSTFQVDTVYAEVSGHSSRLTFQSGIFYGWVDLTGLPQDTLTLNVNAKDVFNNTGSRSVKFIYDIPPQIIVEYPVAFSVARPEIRIKARCVDTRPGCKVRYSNQPAVPDSLDNIIDLANQSGRHYEIGFVAIDDRNQQASQSVPVFVETSPYLEEVYAAPDRIWDVKYGKVLTAKTQVYQHSASSFYHVLNDYKIIDFTTGSGTAIPYSGVSVGIRTMGIGLPTDQNENRFSSFLTPYGAIIAGNWLFSPDTLNNMSVFDWNNGTLSALNTSALSATSFNLKTKGDFAIWKEQVGGALHYRNLQTKTTTVLQPTGPGRAYFNIHNDIAANGNVAAGETRSGTSDVVHYSGGSYTTVSDAVDGRSDMYVLTDGTRSVYRKNMGGSDAAITLFDGTSNVQLSLLSGKDPQPVTHYQINNNFVAFVRSAPTGQSQIWLRLNNGTERQLTFFSGDSELNKLAGDGTVYHSSVVSGLPLSGDRLFARDTAGNLKNISSSLVGRVFESNDSVYMVIGRVLYRIKTSLIPNSIGNFTEEVKKDSSHVFTLNEFSQNFAGDGVLMFVRIDSLPRHGQLLVDGSIPVTQGQLLSRELLSRISYKPAAGYIGTDSIEWSGSNGINYTSMSALVNLHVVSGILLPTVSGVASTYCITAGVQQGKITNLPAASSGVTVSVKLDGNVLQVAADSTFNFTPSTLQAGAHTIVVTFSNSIESRSLTIPFTIDAAVTPDVNITSGAITIINLDPVLVTAVNAAGGGTQPQFTFAGDRNFQNILQGESVVSQLSINPATLIEGDNWIYVRMRSNASCFTAEFNTDSIKLTRVVAPAQPALSGLSAEYCHLLGTQKGKITNLPAATSGTTTVVKLDTTTLAIAADSTFAFQVSLMSTGAHSITVTFTNAAGSKTTTHNMTIIPPVVPDVNLSANTTNITSLANPVVVTATNAAGGGTAPLYTFSKDRPFTNLWQAESASATLTINPSTLLLGDNWVYVKMLSNAGCISSPLAIDSIKLTRDMTTGIIDPDNPGRVINAYPNPVGNQLHISGLSTAKAYSLYIVNVNGQVVQQTRINKQASAILNVQHIVPGTYILNIYTENGKRLTGSLTILKR